MSTTPSISSSASSGGSSGGTVAITIIAITVGPMIVIAILFIKCAIKLKTQSSNALPQSIKDDSATTPPTHEQSTESKLEMASMERFLDDILKERPIRFSSQTLIDLTNNYREKLGSGGFGEVYKGQLLNGVQVAVKVLHGPSDKTAEGQFMAEVGTISRTSHIHLVRLYGFCFDATVKALVYEYMENGSLDKYLFDKNREMEWGKLYEIAVGTAKGIRYLHEECQKKIIHYDIKPGNVLLSANFSPKVADFGLAKLCDRENTHVTITGARGTPGYAAPELWMPFPVTHKCDVYSFGMLLFEILGRRRNLQLDQVESQEWFPRWVWEKFEHGELESVAPLCEIEEKDGEKAARIGKVALWCVQYQPESRPSMSSVVRMLEGEEEIVMPSNPFHHMLPFEALLSSSSWTESTTAGSTSAGSVKESTS